MKIGDRVKIVGHYCHEKKGLVYDETTHAFNLNDEGVIIFEASEKENTRGGYSFHVKMDNWSSPVPFNSGELEVI